MLDGFRHGLPVLFVLLPVPLAWRAWLNSDRNLPAAWQRRVFSTALGVTTADVVLTSGLWFYYWETPFTGAEIIRLALLFGMPASCVAVALLVVGRGKGWWLAMISPAVTLGGWMVAYYSLSR